MKLLTDFLLGKFFKELLILSLIFTFVLLFFQIFNISYLFVSLPFKKVIFYLFLWLSYTYFLATATATPIVLGNFIFTLKEERFFHTLYTFGFSEKKVFNRLGFALLIVSVIGIFSAFFVNYQKISYITKFLKYQYGERILLNVPKQSFYKGEEFSFYFENRKGNKFSKLIVKTPEEIASAYRGELTANGVLKLERFSLFMEKNNGCFLAKGKTYEVSLLGGFHTILSKKKLKKNSVFTVVLFLFPLILYPFMFKVFFKKTDTRFKTMLTAFGFVIVQFVLALVVKSIV
jgi:hypothetical protein